MEIKMTENIETNTALNIDAALRFHSRLHYEISRALKQHEVSRIDVDIDEVYGSVTLSVPLDFSFQGEKIFPLLATLHSTEAFKWYVAEEVSDDDAAQFAVHFTSFDGNGGYCDYDEFNLCLYAEDVIPHKPKNLLKWWVK
jgi:hypothetical protein